MDAPRMTIPTRAKAARWDLGDLVTVPGGTRYVIRRIDRTTGRVVLEAMNTTNHAEWWDTTLDKLPGRTA